MKKSLFALALAISVLVGSVCVYGDAEMECSSYIAGSCAVVRPFDHANVNKG